jgi:hypothetical protein
MTTTRLLTTAVQLGIGIPALLMLRLAIKDFLENGLD